MSSMRIESSRVWIYVVDFRWEGLNQNSGSDDQLR